jgi:hypothetical protein
MSARVRFLLCLLPFLSHDWFTDFTPLKERVVSVARHIVGNAQPETQSDSQWIRVLLAVDRPDSESDNIVSYKFLNR